MIEPYMAVALQIDHWETGGKRANIKKNLDHIEKQLQIHVPFNSMQYPVRLVALPEGGLQGWGWAFSEPMKPAEYAKEGAITVPGEESDRLGELAKKYNIYLRFEAITVEPDWPEHFFNKSFIIDPNGKVILQAYKNHVTYPMELSHTPHDLWDEWVKKYVKDPNDWKSWMDAFYPVVDTDIGKLGSLICGQTSYPEEGRGLAMNGAEVIIKCNYMNPWTNRPTGYEGTFTLLSRMHAYVNTCYTVNPNYGDYYMGDTAYTFGGFASICDYMGIVLSQVGAESNTTAAATIDIEALRKFRTRMGIATTQIPIMRTENFRIIYEKPIYPKNTRLGRPWESANEIWESLQKVYQDLVKRGIYTPPGK